MSPSAEPSQGGPAGPERPGEQLHVQSPAVPGPALPGKAAVLGGRQGLAWCPPCPLPTALCPHRYRCHTTHNIPAKATGGAQSSKCLSTGLQEDGQGTSPGRKPSQAGLPSSDGPRSGTEAGSTACPAVPRPTIPGKTWSGGAQAGPCLCPWPTALCPAHAASPHSETRCWWPPASCPGMRAELPQWAAVPWGLPCGDQPSSASAPLHSAARGLRAALDAPCNASGKDLAHSAFLLSFSCRRAGGSFQCW